MPNNPLTAVIAAIIIALCVPATTSCRRARLRDGDTRQRTTRIDKRPHRGHRGSKQTITMREDGGVYLVPVQVNGVDMEFVFDTGASMVTMSVVEATMLYRQGKLTRDDFKGTGDFIDATGRVSTSAIFNLRDVTLGGITVHDVEASVSASLQAPLLLGQSALSRFGTVTIDYKRNCIILNN